MFSYFWFSKLPANASCELPIKTNKCDIQLLHYFSSPGQYILPIVLYNEVLKQVIPLKINIYEGICFRVTFVLHELIFYLH